MSRKIQTLLVTNSIKLVESWNIYSCPDKAYYPNPQKNDIVQLRVRQNSERQRIVLEQWTSDQPDDYSNTPSEWRMRHEGYVLEAKRGGVNIFKESGAYRFYALGEVRFSNSPNMPSTEHSTDWDHFIERVREEEKTDGLLNDAVNAVWQQKDQYFCWTNAKDNLVLYRTARHPDGNCNNCYDYPEYVLQKIRDKGLKPDCRNNGPAILAFLIAGGKRPTIDARGWPIHHIYDGRAKHPFSGNPILHAIRDPDFFTDSRGLVAAHPSAHYLVHRSDLLAWYLRREAFQLFGFDPDKIFTRLV